MIVEVRHFSGDYYTVHYQKWWFWPFMTEWGEPDDCDWSYPMLIKRKDVCLMRYEEAKKLAESLTPERVEAHERELSEIYERAVARTRAKLAARRARGFSIER